MKRMLISEMPEHTNEKECIFCKIVNKEIPAQIIYEDELIIAFNDISPVAPVHILVIPKKHIPNLLELAPGDSMLLSHIHLKIAEIAKQQNIADSGFRVVTNINDEGGQTVKHLHWHILGKRFMQWPPG